TSLRRFFVRIAARSAADRMLVGGRAETPYLPLQGGGRQHLLRFEANAVGWGSGPWRVLLLIIAAARGPPPGPPPTKSGVADLPLSAGGIAESAAPLSPLSPVSIQIEFFELAVVGRNPAHGTGNRAHNHRLGGDHLLAHPHALEQRPIGH